MTEPPYRPEPVVKTVVERHYHFEGLAKVLMLAVIVAAGAAVTAAVAYVATHPGPPPPCVEQVYDMKDYARADCTPPARAEASGALVTCRCPRP